MKIIDSKSDEKEILDALQKTSELKCIIPENIEPYAKLGRDGRFYILYRDKEARDE